VDEVLEYVALARSEATGDQHPAGRLISGTRRDGIEELVEAVLHGGLLRAQGSHRIAVGNAGAQRFERSPGRQRG